MGKTQRYMKHFSLFCDDCRSGGLQGSIVNMVWTPQKNNALLGTLPIPFEMLPRLAGMHDTDDITHLHILFLRCADLH